MLQREFMDLQISQIDFEVLVELGRPLSDSWKMVVPSPNEYTLRYLRRIRSTPLKVQYTALDVRVHPMIGRRSQGRKRLHMLPPLMLLHPPALQALEAKHRSRARKVNRTDLKP